MEKYKQLIDIDLYYSKLSEEKGMNAAFLAMFDTNGVMLQANKPPIEGYKAIQDLLLSQNDSYFTLSWVPIFAKVAASEDLGYTYGTYKIINGNEQTEQIVGTYTTIWQKEIGGEWKAVLDTGNPGLE